MGTKFLSLLRHQGVGDPICLEACRTFFVRRNRSWSGPVRLLAVNERRRGVLFVGKQKKIVGWGRSFYLSCADRRWAARSAWRLAGRRRPSHPLLKPKQSARAHRRPAPGYSNAIHTSCLLRSDLGGSSLSIDETSDDQRLPPRGATVHLAKPFTASQLDGALQRVFASQSSPRS
jgi:hypothetical protein